MLTGHEDSVNHLAFSPDGQLLATASWDGTAKLWDTASGKQLAVFDMPSHCRDVVFSPDGKLLACASGDDAMLFDVASRKRLHLLRGHQNSADCIAFSPNGRLLVTGSHDRTIRIWNVETGKAKHVIAAHREKIHSVAFSPDGRTIASGDERGTIAFSHLETGRFLFDTKVGIDKVRCLQFSPDGETLAVTVAQSGLILIIVLRIDISDSEQLNHSQPLLESHRNHAEIEATPVSDLPLGSITVSARAEFLSLGLIPNGFSNSSAIDVNTDGSVVTGFFEDFKRKRKPFRSEQGTGMHELAAGQGFVTGLVDEGGLPFGVALQSGLYRATIWHSPSIPTYLPLPSERPELSHCEAASADGSVLVGWLKDSSNGHRALRWTAEGVELLDPYTVKAQTMATAISSSGKIIVGMEWTGSELNDRDARIQPVRWNSFGVQRLPMFDQNYNWFVKDISSDGSVLSGMRWPVGALGPWRDQNGTMCFRWENGMITLLGDLPGGDTISYGPTSSADGRIVVGTSHISERNTAFVWDAAHGMRSLESVLRRYGVDVEDWWLETATSISGDGLAIVGWGIHKKSGRREAWLARLPKQAFAPSR
jgi:WD40 repeat protein